MSTASKLHNFSFNPSIDSAPVAKMRATLCRLAKPVVNTRTEAKFLTAGAPTGLTGLLTHPSPRPTRLVLYKKTLSRLQTLPESSSYRASATALTQHRLSIVEKIIPAGYEEWKVKAQAILEEHEGILDDTNEFDGHEIDGEILVTQNLIEEVDELEQSWDGETGGPELEGTRMPSERNFEIMGDKKHFAGLIRKREGVKWDPEPGLDSAQ